MPDGKVHLHARRRGAITEENLHCVADIALVGSVVLLSEGGVLPDLHPRAQGIDRRVRGDLVLVVPRRQATEQQRDGHHVLNAMIAIRGVRKGAGLIDDANARLLRLDDDPIDVRDPVLHLRMQRQRRFDSGLSMELGGK